MRKLLVLILVLMFLFAVIKPVRGDILIGKKNFIGCWEDTNVGVGNYTTILANNSQADLGFSWDYYIVEKEEVISIDRVTVGEVCYLSVMWVSNSSSTWVKGTTMLRAKADGNDVNLVFTTLPVDSRYICRDCCMANINITINNDYQINDHILWLHVANGAMSVYWSGLAVFKYYLYSEGDSEKTSTIQGEPFDPLDEAEELWRAFGPALFIIVIICIVISLFIFLMRRIR